MWGDNTDHVLGMALRRSDVPEEITTLQRSDIVSIHCGFRHTFAISEKGEVLSWGYGRHGVLGNGLETLQTTPQVIQALKGIRVCQLATGGMHAIALSGMVLEVIEQQVYSDSVSAYTFF